MVLDINLFLEVSIFIIHLKRHSTICVTQSSAQGLGCRFDLKWRVVNVDQCRPTRPLKVVAKHPVPFFFSKHAVTSATQHVSPLLLPGSAFQIRLAMMTQPDSVSLRF